jgi:hypothetical protein
MRLNPPRRTTWWIALVCAILALAAYSGIIGGFFGNLAFILMLIAYVLLAISTTVKGI